jgi:GT2 family glycosyltransferase
MIKVAIVILNWNGKDFLEKFLPQVLAHNAPYAEVIIADNASTDDSISFLRLNYPQVRIIQNTVNGGFAKGYNDALKHVSAEYYVLLNSDVEVTPRWVEPVIELMESDPAIAACQPKIRAFNNREFFEYAGAAGGFIDKFTYPFCRGRIFDSFERDTGQYDDTREVFWATGACLFVRSDVFHKVSGFDVDFFAHMEEIDLCWRIKNMGYRIMYCPGSTVFHVGGGTLAKTNPRKTYLNFRNNLLLMCKNHDPRFFVSKLLTRMVLDGIAGLKFLLSGDVSHFSAVVRAHCSFYGMFGKTMSKRKALQKQVKQYTTTAIYRRSIVIDYYLRGKRKFSELEEKFF